MTHTEREIVRLAMEFCGNNRENGILMQNSEYVELPAACNHELLQRLRKKIKQGIGQPDDLLCNHGSHLVECYDGVCPECAAVPEASPQDSANVAATRSQLVGVDASGHASPTHPGGICTPQGDRYSPESPALPEASPRMEHNWPFEMAQQRVEIVERMMKLPYIKAQRDTEKGQERFVCRDDVITMIHNYAKELRAAVPEASPAHDENCQWWHRLPCTCEPPPEMDYSTVIATMADGEPIYATKAAPLAQQHTHTPRATFRCCLCGWICTPDGGLESRHSSTECGRQHAEHVRELSRLTDAEKKINKAAHKADSAGQLGTLKKIRDECQKLTGHRMEGTFDGFDRCKVCGQPGEWEAR